MSFLTSKLERCSRLLSLGALTGLLGATAAATASAQDELTEFDFLLLGLSVSPEPELQTVPRNTATGLGVGVHFASSSSSADETLLLQLLPPGLEVAAELVGPGIVAPIQLRGAPGELLPIPPLVTKGVFLVRDIRLVVGDDVFLRASPDTATVEVIERVLITSVTTRPLTLEEIRQKGILFGDDNFTGFNFRLALRLDSRPVEIDLPVIFDSNDIPVPLRQTADIGVTGPGLPIINTGLTPVMMKPDLPALSPDVLAGLPSDIRIPGLLVVPGEIGFLNQFFSALLLVSNGSPAGSNLTVSGLTGEIVLPEGPDAVPDSGDEPLALAVTDGGPLQGESVADIVGLGLDGVIGTGDDTFELGTGEQGQAEYLIEGRSEGFHEIRFDIRGTLEGLPVGSIPITGVARGGVLVRNPDFQLTFSAPATVRAQEAFTLYITVSNISDANAPLVRVALGGGVSGASLAPGEPDVLQIEDLGPGDSEVLPFRFISTQTGQVTASYLKVEGGTGNLLFRLGVGERGVPLSPDMIVLPTTVAALASPTELLVGASPRVVEAATRVLGLAWSTATAPAGTLPGGVTRVSKQSILGRATELAEAGFRVQLGESLERALVELALSWIAADDAGFEEIVRETDAGAAFLAAIGDTLAELPTLPPEIAALNRALAGDLSSRARHLLIGVGRPGEDPPVDLVVSDASGGGGAVSSNAASTLTRAGFVPLGGSSGLALIPELGSNNYGVTLAGTAVGTFDLTLNVPVVGGGTSVYVFEDVAVDPDVVARLALDLRTAPSTLSLTLERNGVVEATVESQPADFLAPRGPKLLAATVIGPETLNGADPWGRLLAVLFDREVRPAEAEDVASYDIETNEILSALRQSSGRLVFLFMRDPLGNFVPRNATVTGLFDPTGKPMTPFTQTAAVTSRIQIPGAVVSGRVLNAEGQPVPGAEILYMNSVSSGFIGLSLKPVDDDGSYSFDYVRRGDGSGNFAIRARDPDSGTIQQLSTRVNTDGEHLTVDLVLRGRGGAEGFVTDLAGDPRTGARVLVTSQADPTSFAFAETDGDGYYQATGLVVGPVTVKAVDLVFSGVASGNLLRAGTFARVDVTLNAGQGRVSGRVLELAEGAVSAALPGVDVYFVTEDDFVAASTKTDALGSYAFENLPTGTFRVVAVDVVTGRQTSSVIQALDAGGDLSIDVFFEMEAVGTIRGTVSDETGPLAGAQVQAAGRLVATEDLVSGAEFVIPNVPVGTHTVTATLPGTNRTARASVAVVEAGTTRVDLRLSGTGQVLVSVLDPAGLPIPNQQVIRVSGTDPCAGQSLVTAADGTATFTGVIVPGATFKASRGGDIAVGTATLAHEGEVVAITLRFAGFGTVFGIVTDDNGPVFGADVSLGARRFDAASCTFVPDGRARQIRTSSLGGYRFENVPLGSVSVTARAGTGTSLPATAKDALIADGEVKEINLTLTDNLGGELSGTVFLPDGTTPVGAGVKVSTSSNIGAEVTVTTDAAGHFELAKILAPGRYVLEARDPVTGRVAKSTVYLQLEQDLTSDLRLLARGTVDVTVLDGSGTPVEEAFVELSEAEFPFDERAGALVPTDQGVVRFERVSEGNFTITVSSNGRGGRASGVVSSEGSTTNVSVTLTSVGTLFGVVRTPAGSEGVANAELILEQGATGRLLGATTTSAVPSPVPAACQAVLGTEALGTFELTSVPAGSLLATATDPLTGRVGEASSTIANDGETACVEVRLLGLGTVAGKVVNGVDPLPGAQVTLTSSRGLSAMTHLTAEATADGAGNFRFEGIPVGSFTLKATVPGELLTGTETGAITADGEVIEDLIVALEDSGTVSGTVFESDGTTPVPGARVTLRPPKGRLQTETNADGSFHFDFVPSGAFELTAEENGGFDTGILEGTLAASENLEGLELVFNGTGTIRGRAFDSNDTLLDSGLVRLSTPEPFARSETATVNALGEFRFVEVPSGPFELTLTVSGSPLRGLTAGTVAADETLDADVTLQEARPVRGLVLRDDAVTAAPNASVTLRISGFTLRTLTDAAGALRIEGVPLGNFELTVEEALTAAVARASGVVEESTPATGLDLGDLVLDSTPISVAITSPSAGETLVPPDRVIDVTFTDPVGSGGVVGLVTVATDGAAVPGSLAILPDGVTARFTASPTLPPRASITVTVDAALKDIFDRPLGDDFVSSFTTGGSVVTGLVTNFGSPVAAADVVLTTGGSSVSTTTDAVGRYRFENVDTGGVSVVATSGSLAGSKVVDIGPSDGLVTVDIPVSVVGALQGLVTEFDGSPSTAGLTVRVLQLNQVIGLGATTFDGTNARYLIENIPLGPVTIDVTNEANGDRQQATGTLVEAGVAVDVPVQMLGVGEVEVLVEDSLGAPVRNASVELSFTRFGSRTVTPGLTDDTGSIVFGKVVSGAVDATASALGLTTSRSGDAVAGTRTQLFLTLQALGGLTGTVFAPDGTTPVAGASVELIRESGNVSQGTLTTDADGTYTFPDIPAQDAAYRVDVRVDGSLRARARGVTVPSNTNGVLDVVLIEVGTVTGTLSSSAGLSSSTTVTLESRALGFRRFQTTAVADQYVIDGVPAGPFDVSARDTVNGTLGEAAGAMPAEGGTVVVDIELFENTFTIPSGGYILNDGNGSDFRILASGASKGGRGNVFTGVNGGANFLELTVGTATTRFTGAALGFREEADRELVTASETIGGLAVQRKIYVPEDGYFARYLEVLDNSGDTAIDARLAIVSEVNPGDGPAVVVDELPNQWVVLDDAKDVDTFEEAFRNITALAFVMDETGALAQVQPLDDGASADMKRLTTLYDVTVPAKGRVVVMHFAVQQLSRAAGTAAAERLHALAPEALVGIEGDEIAAIVNFTVPVDGSSVVPPLPPGDGFVSGTLRGVASDGSTVALGVATGVRTMNVEIQSDHILFRRIYGTTTANGEFQIDNAGRVFPRTGYRLRGFKTIGVFTTEKETVADFVGESLLSHAPDAVLDGSSRFNSISAPSNVLNPNPAVSWRPAASDPDPRLTWSLPTPVAVGEILVVPRPNASTSLDSLSVVLDGVAQSHPFPTPDGELRVALDPPVDARNIELGFTGSLVQVGVVEIHGTTPTDIGSSRRELVFDASAAIEIAVADVTGTPVPATGNAKVGNTFWTGLTAPEGTLYFGPLAPEAPIELNFTRSDLGHPFHQVREFPVTLTAGTATPVTLSFGPGANLSGHVRNNGVPVANASVIVFANDISGAQTSVRTDVDGFYQLENVASGSYSLRVFVGGRNHFADVAIAGAPVVQDFFVVDPGTVNVELRYESGDASVVFATGATVRLTDNEGGVTTRSTGTTGASAGRTTFTNIPAGAFTLAVTHPTNSASITESVHTVASGQEITIQSTIPAFGTLTANVTLGDGSPANGAQVTLQGTGVTTAPRFTAGGATSFTNVPGLVDVSVTARHPAAGRTHITVTDTVRIVNQGDAPAVALELPATGDVVVTVTREGTGDPVAGVDVFIRDAFATQLRAEGVTDANGQRTISIVPLGAFTIRGERAGELIGETTASITTDGESVPVALTVPVDASVEGFIFAGDGTTPLEGARVELLTADGSTVVSPTTAGADGFYRFDNLVAPDMSNLVRATYVSDATKQAEQLVTAGSTGELITLDLTVPVSVIRGTVFEPDGTTPVDAAGVELTAYGSLDVTTSVTDAAGGFLILNETPGTYEVVVEDGFGLASTTTAVLVSVDEALQLDLPLPDYGTVEVSVLDENAVPVSGAPLTLRSGALRVARAALADPDDVFRFTRVALGAFSVTYDDGGTRSGNAVGKLTSAAPLAQVTVGLPGLTAVFGELRDAGVVALPNAEFTPVSVEGRLLETESGGGIQSTGGEVDLDFGTYRVESVPEGVVTVTVDEDGVVGATAVTVTAAVPEHEVHVERDSALGFPAPLSASFELQADGALLVEGTLANIAFVNDKRFAFLASTARDLAEPNHVALGPIRTSGLLYTRDVFTASGGAFVRTLEVFENPYAFDVEVTLRLEGDTAVSDTESGAGALVPADHYFLDGAKAHVFGGSLPGSRQPEFAGASATRHELTWREVVVPANGRIAVMHFTVAAASAGQARSLADSLVDLSHPGALVALDPTLRADIVNFGTP